VIRLSKSFKLHKIKIPIPIPALKHVNSYLIDFGEELLIIDTGTPVDFTTKALFDSIEELGYKLSEITKIFVTHMHVDHIGNVPFIQDLSNAPLYMNKDEYEFVKYFILSPEISLKDLENIFYKNGVPKDEISYIIKKHPALSKRNKYKMIKNVKFVNDGELIKIGETTLRIIETPGHSPHHICIYLEEEKLLFTGDHVLPDITPNIRLPIGEEDPLEEYLQSLKKVENLDVEEYFPAHRDPDKSLSERVKELKIHHFERLLEVGDILSDNWITAFETASKMDWDVKIDWRDFPPSQKFFAIGEALAHIIYLVNKGFVKMKDCNGLYRFKITTGKSHLENALKQLIFG